MKKRFSLAACALFALALAAAGLLIACGGDGGGAGGGIQGQVPDSFPQDWRSLSGAEWEILFESFEESDLTDQDFDAMVAFIQNNYDLLSEEGKAFWRFALPEDTHGIDVNNWPTDHNLNSFNSGSSLYFRKSEDGLALAANPRNRGNGGGIYEPDIYILQAGTGGAFPIGVWLNRNEEILTFTATTVTYDTPYDYDIRKANYTMTADTFVLNNFTTMPYAPTADDLAKLATYNETSFRSDHPWVPASSTIAAKVKRDEWFYDIVDNPVMEPFASDSDAISTWAAHDYIDGGEVSSYTPPAAGNARGAYSGIELLADGTVKVQNRYAVDPSVWYNNGTWTAAPNTYTGGKIPGPIASGIIDSTSGNPPTAPEFAVKDYGAQGIFLFVQNKSGDYSMRAREPSYEVYKKQQ